MQGDEEIDDDPVSVATEAPDEEADDSADDSESVVAEPDDVQQQFRPEDQRSETDIQDIPELGSNADPDLGAEGVHIGDDYGPYYPYDAKATFGCVIDGNKVSIYNARARRFGELNGDGTVKTWTATPNPITITLANGAGQRIVWDFDPNGGGLSIRATALSNDPSAVSPVVCGIVAIFDVTAGQADLAAGIGATDQLGHLLWLPMEAPA